MLYRNELSAGEHMEELFAVQLLKDGSWNFVGFLNDSKPVFTTSVRFEGYTTHLQNIHKNPASQVDFVFCLQRVGSKRLVPLVGKFQHKAPLVSN
jgi:hypothetical protein